MNPEYADWTTPALEEEEARLSLQIQALDQEIAEKKERMRQIDREVNPIRNELEERRWQRARRDPRTQGIGD